MSFHYRQLLLPELPLIQQVGRASYEPYYPHLWKPGGVDWYMQRCFGENTLRNELADPNLEYWLAQDEAGQSVGFLKLVLQKELPPEVQLLPGFSRESLSENAFYLEKVYLLPEYFGKGAGQDLIRFAKTRASTLGRDTIWLIVMKTGPVWVYEKAGFQTVGEISLDFELLREAERGAWAMFQNLRTDSMM